MIDVLVLGTGAMLPLPNRWLSSFVIRCRGELILFDCGEGTQISWRQFGWGFRRLSAICFSHWHADHIAGLPGLLHTLANADRTEPITIFGPSETARVVAGLRVIAPELPFEVNVVELASGDTFSLPAGLEGKVLEGDHRVPVLAYRISLDRARRFRPERAEELEIPRRYWQALQRGQSVKWSERRAIPDDVLGPPRKGISFGFATDTRPTAEMGPFFSGVDLLITEGTYGESDHVVKARRNKHMTFEEAATIARGADARSLWLTHFSPAMDDPDAFLNHATAIFPHTTIAYTGLTTSLTFDDALDF